MRTQSHKFDELFTRIMTAMPGYATPEGTAKFAQASTALDSNYKQFLNLTLSNVGIGTYLGDADANTDDMMSSAIVMSIKSGVNVIDTAINYRAQKSERAVGRAIASMIGEEEDDDNDNNNNNNGKVTRDQLFVCTKGGYVTNDADTGQGFWEYVKDQYTDTGIVKSDEITSSYHCMSPAYLSNQIDRSLSNMNLECIDLAYLHNAVEGQIKDVSRDQFLENLRGVMKMYEDRRAQGKIRYYGMATWECFRVDESNTLYISLEDVVSMAREIGGDAHGFRFVQLPFNMYYDQALLSEHQQIDGVKMSMLDAASRLGVGIFTSVPFMQGRLLQPETMPAYSDDPPVLRALQFIRSAPGVLAPLVGQKTPEHVQENMGVMKVPPFSPDQFDATVKKLTA